MYLDRIGIAAAPMPTPTSADDASGAAAVVSVAGCVAFSAAASLLVAYAILATIRRRARRLLERGRCNLPTVSWRPRFVNYAPLVDDEECDDDEVSTAATTKKKKKMPSTSITGVLPRMERLGGPYGMYGTVYGVSTRVVHVAHPVPARLILSGGGGSSGSGGDAKSSHGRRRGRRRSSAHVASTSGATKNPAYDHFKDFSGDGVFTADGDEWKAKRSSVVHCLLRGCTNDNSDASRRLVHEANRAADAFAREVEASAARPAAGARGGGAGGASVNINEGKAGGVVNVVPMMQRSTIGLIYRFITHHDVDMVGEGRHQGDGGVNVEARSSATSTSTKCDVDAKCSDDEPTDDMGSPRSSASSLSSLAAPASPPDDDDTDDEDEDQDTRSRGTSRDACIAPLGTTRAAPDDDNDDAGKRQRALLPSYLRSVTQIRMIILAQSRSVWFLLPRWVYRTFSPMYRDETRTMIPIRAFATSACRNAVPGSPLALLRDRESHGGGESGGGESGVGGRGGGGGVSKAMLDEAITLLFAGQDTSAATLSWTLHLLSLYPDVQDRLAREVRDVVREHLREDRDGASPKNGTVPPGDGKTDRLVFTKALVSKMPLLDAVLKESMRLYPVAPFVVRKLPFDLTVPPDDEGSPSKSTTVLPAGSIACIWIYGLHRNKRLWDRPDDFVPDRWIDPDLRGRDKGQMTNGAYMPFAAGPRNCVGQPLAHVVLRILLARIMRDYAVVDPRLKKDPCTDSIDPVKLRKDMQAGFTVLPSGGVKLKLERRFCEASPQ